MTGLKGFTLADFRSRCGAINRLANLGTFVHACVYFVNLTVHMGAIEELHENDRQYNVSLYGLEMLQCINFSPEQRKGLIFINITFGTSGSKIRGPIGSL